MAALRTQVFGPRYQQLLGSYDITPRADVFAPMQRQSTTSSYIQERWTTAQLQFGDRRIFISYRDDGRGLPEWAAPTLRSLSERWGMEPGWDTYQAKPTDAQLAGRLFGYLLTLMQRNSTPPVITPLADGGLQAEWHHNNQALEIVVPADDSPTYFYSNPAAHQEEEHELEQSFTRVRDLISHF